MKRILFLIIAGLVVMSGLVFADSNWTYENVEIFGPRMGPEGITPPIKAVKVSLGSDDSAAVGDAVVWDLAPSDGSGLGYVVAICDRNTLSDDVGGDIGKGPFAGVMITITSKETEWSTAKGSDQTIGYMAIRGFCDAKVLDAYSNIGDRLVLLGSFSAGYFGTMHMANKGKPSIPNDPSPDGDIGVLLEDTNTDGLMKVWLR